MSINILHGFKKILSTNKCLLCVIYRKKRQFYATLRHYEQAPPNTSFLLCSANSRSIKDCVWKVSYNCAEIYDCDKRYSYIIDQNKIVVPPVQKAQ